MAGSISTPSSIRISHLFPSILHPKQPPPPQLSTRAIEPDKENAAETESSSSSSSSPSTKEDGEFENRLSRVRLKYRSGTGKKAELRKAKKTGGGASSKKKGGDVFLPPVALKEPVSGGMKVDFGFTPYTERLNGRLAELGLAALLLVELWSGKSLLSYHALPTIFIQIYFVASLSALFIKYEKEKVSIWPQPSTSPSPPLVNK